MPLGIEPNNIAPALIQNSGAALVQGIRQIGQQISGHLTEMQTKRDLGALAQEMQGLNVQSNEFPIQLAQLTARHPLAARDQRGQMVLAPLGMAHAQWQAGESEARAFGRQMQLMEMRNTAAETAAVNQEERIRSRPTRVPGVGLADPLTGEVIVPELPRPSASSTAPRVLSPGAVLVDPTGKKIAENPRAATASASEARLKKKFNMDLLTDQDKQTQREIEAAIRRRDSLTSERMKITKADDPNAAYLDNTVKAIEDEVKALRERRNALRKQIEKIESTPVEEEVVVEPELGIVPPGAVAPPPADPNALVPVINPQGKATNIKRSQLEAALQGGYRQR